MHPRAILDSFKRQAHSAFSAMGELTGSDEVLYRLHSGVRQHDGDTISEEMAQSAAETLIADETIADAEVQDLLFSYAEAVAGMWNYRSTDPFDPILG